MPSRKSGSSETTLADSRRTSLRRLSSIASFPTLFNRRRPNNTTDHTGQSPSSNLSLSSSTVANAPDAGSTDFSTSTRSLLQHEDSISDLPSHPLPTQLPSRRSSYICLPDDPIGGMPRSRTFSNLPLPTRAKKTNSMVPSNSHSRLPSALLPSTRLPSPPTSTRKHSHTRLTSAETKQAPVRNRVKRSDTEPLLAVDAQQRAPSHLPRSTAFKENISLSPIRHLPALDMFHHHENSHDCSSPYHAQRVWKESSSEASEPLLSDSFSSSSPPLSRYAQHPAIQIAREHKSSPAYRSSRERRPTPGASSLNAVSAQRWNSHPVLTTRTNTIPRTSNQRGNEIKQTRLLSARQAPTPPPPKTPLSSRAVAAGGKVKTANNSTPRIRSTVEQTPLHTRSSNPPTSSTPRSIQINTTSSLHLVSNPEPPAYWSGRLCALADRYRNDELTLHLSTPTNNPSPKAQTDKMHTPEASLARTKRALEYLQACCTTPEARGSLAAFQGKLAGVMGLPELKPKMLSLSLQSDAAEVGGGDGTAYGGAEMRMSEGRKISFMDRLLGRQGKRRSLVMA